MLNVLFIFAQIRIFYDRSFGNRFAEFPVNVLCVVVFFFKLSYIRNLGTRLNKTEENSGSCVEFGLVRFRSILVLYSAQTSCFSELPCCDHVTGLYRKTLLSAFDE
jgi:hypothetical protein